MKNREQVKWTKKTPNNNNKKGITKYFKTLRKILVLFSAFYTLKDINRTVANNVAQSLEFRDYF